MPNASGASPPLPAELIPDFERFRAALGEGRFAALFRPVEGGATEALRVRAWREYGRLLYEKSADLALVSKGDRAHLYTRHILDSLNPVSLFTAPPSRALDIGSGGGLPGIPLAIAWPETQVLLLESRERKAGFLEQAVRRLELRNARVVCARLEDLHAAWRSELFDVVFVRAVGDLPAVLGAVSPVVCSGGCWVYFLGSRSPEEALSGSPVIGRAAQGAFGGRLLTGTFSSPH